MSARTPSRQSYTVDIVCALDVEKTAVYATLDEEYDRAEKAAGDDNAYTLGRIGAHNVVVACLPAGVIGTVSAMAVAKDMMRSSSIKVGLMVGICGGIWSEKTDIRLGDVVVSQPDGIHEEVVQWDYGKMEKEGVFRRTGTLNKPPRPLLNAVQSLKARHRLRGNEVARHIHEAFTNFPLIEEEYRH
jgi:nucleoside phosphorylase